MMNSKSKNIVYFYEKFKAFLLVFLMMLCIVQIGILWSSQSGSFPISLFSNLKSSSPTSIDESKSEYLLPYRVVISTGFDGEHYLIPNGSNEYKTLWKGAKEYIRQALVNKPKQIQPFTQDAWGTLVANKPYTFEFKTQIPIDIIKWTLDDIKTPAGEGLAGIYKVVICPDDADNSYSDTLYIRDNKNIYTYEIKNYTSNALDKDEFSEIYTKMQSNTDVKPYQMAIEKLRKFPISLDLLGIFSGKKSEESYPNITCQPIEGLADTEYTYENLNKMAQDLFGNATNNYDPDLDVNGSVVFKKGDGVYRLYKNSILEYRFTGIQGIVYKPSVLEAYKKAIAFILEHRSQNNIMSNVSVYLNSYEEKQGSYIFKFDYSVTLGEGKGEIPIILKDYQIPIPNSTNKLDNSISIEASSRNVLHFEWLALKFKVDKRLENYEWNFGDMYEKVYKNNVELKKEEFSVKDFGIYYVLNYPKMQEHSITPSFVLFTKAGRYDITMEGNNK